MYHAGDTALFGDMRLIGERGIDLAFLPVGDTYTMGPEEAARTLDLLKPKHAIPMHYGTFPPLTGDPQVFAAEARQRGVEAHVMQPGQTLEL
jgi:L-ascorbate metabolism protein UlaG (beta-lactamase superfamily)